MTARIVPLARQFHNVGKGYASVTQRSEKNGSHARLQFTERRIAADVNAERQRIHERSHHVFKFRPLPSRSERTEDNFTLARIAMQ